MLASVCIGTVFEYCATALSLVYAEVLAREFMGDMLWCMYAVQLIAVVFRPLGGYALGAIGDSTSPLAALRYSTCMMLCSTCCMACIPGEEIIGVYALILFLLLQCMQMLSAGGELNFAAIHLIDNMNHKGLASGIAWAATSVGWLCAWCLKCIFPEEQWRLAYALTALLGVASFFIRSSTTCNAIDGRQHTNAQPSLHRSSHCVGVIVTFLWAAAVGAYTYYTLQYCKAYVSEACVVVAYILAVVANIVSGYLYDVYGRYSVKCGLVASAIVLLLNLSAEKMFVVFPLVLSLWKAPTHVLSQRFVHASKKCGSIATFYSLGTSIAGRGTMICCYALDTLSVGLSAVWPVCAVLLGCIALSLDTDDSQV